MSYYCLFYSTIRKSTRSALYVICFVWAAMRALNGWISSIVGESIASIDENCLLKMLNMW